MKVSFCTTCMGRRHHIEKTLLKNIEDNLPKKEGDPEVEFVLLDYSSKDKLKEWVESNEALRPYLENGTLVYARYEDAKRFHHSHAKNMAHRLATGDVVCNVDADNFTGKGFARFLAGQFAGGVHAIVYPAFKLLRGLPNDEKGFFGRIAMRRDDFMQLGGYEETRFKKGWGHEDVDLITRAVAHGIEARPMYDGNFMHTIAHTDAERIANTEGGINANDSKISLVRPIKMFFNIYLAEVQANKGGHFGEGTITRLRDQSQVIKNATLAPVSGRSLSAIFPQLRNLREEGRELRRRRAAARPAA